MLVLGLELWVWLVMAAWIGAAAAVWFGWHKPELDNQHPILKALLYQCSIGIPIFPWTGPIIMFMMLWGILRQVGITFLDGVGLPVILSLLAFAWFVGIFQWPRWALPPWYRKRLEEKQKERQNPTKKSSRRRRGSDSGR